VRRSAPSRVCLVQRNEQCGMLSLIEAHTAWNIHFGSAARRYARFRSGIRQFSSFDLGDWPLRGRSDQTATHVRSTESRQAVACALLLTTHSRSCVDRATSRSPQRYRPAPTVAVPLFIGEGECVKIDTRCASKRWCGDGMLERSVDGGRADGSCAAGGVSAGGARRRWSGRRSRCAPAPAPCSNR
jgi:hypothetical protein